MFKPIVALAAIMCLTGGAGAQTAAPAAASRGGGGLAGLLGQVGVPDIASVGAGNAAGLLGYCLKNRLLGAGAPVAAGQATGAQSILQRLTGRQGVTTSPGYAAGQAGQVQAGGGQTLSLDALRGQVKTRMCSLVLDRATSFL